MNVRARLVVRHLFGRPLETVISLTGIALGVGVVLAVELVNSSANRAFDIASESVAGGMSHEIISDTGSFDENIYPLLKKQYRVRNAMPIVTGGVQTPVGGTVILTGIDPVPLIGAGSTPNDALLPVDSPLSLMINHGTAYLGTGALAQFGVDVPATVSVTVQGYQKNLRLAGVLDNSVSPGARALEFTMLADISTAQDVLGMAGKLSRIELDIDQQTAASLGGSLSPPLQLIELESRTAALEQLTRAFRTNLAALGLLALVIGSFLIYNTMSLSVLRRYQDIAVLRTLGMDKREIFVMVQLSAMLLALTGILAGFVIGAGLARSLIGMASQTISDLYFVEQVRGSYTGIGGYIRAALLGLVATALATWLPARDAYAVSPEPMRSRSRLERSVLQKGTITKWFAAVFLLLAAAVVMMTDRSVITGFVSLFFIIMAFTLVVPVLLTRTVLVLKPPLRCLLGLPGELAGRNVLAAMSRTQVAVAALSIAIAATVGLSIMIGSFRHAVGNWLSGYLQAEVYVSGDRQAQYPAFTDDLVRAIRSSPGVDSLGTTAVTDLWQAGRPLRFSVVDMDRQAFEHYQFIKNLSGDLWKHFTNSDAVIVSEPFAYHHQVEIGDYLSLPTEQGDRALVVIGIYRDYGSSQGRISVYRETWRKYRELPPLRSMFIYLQPGIEIDGFIQRLNDNLLASTGLYALSGIALREMSMEIFDRTFTITEVLRILIIVIAAAGIVGGLTAIQIERIREFALLRATGLTPQGLYTLIMAESGLMGVISGIIAIPLGAVLALMLVYIINRRSFGWSMQALIGPGDLLIALLIGLLAGLCAGIYPAWRLTRTSLAEALRHE